MGTADALAMEVDTQFGLTALAEPWNSGNPARGSVGSYRDLEEALRIDAARWKSFRERVKAARERAIDLREALRALLVPRIEASHERAVRRAIQEWASLIAGGGPKKAGLSRGSSTKRHGLIFVSRTYEARSWSALGVRAACPSVESSRQ